MTLRKLFGGLWFTFYGTVVCLLSVLQNCLISIQTKSTMGKRKHKKKHTKIINLCGIFDGMYDDWYDEVEDGYGSIIYTKKSIGKKAKKAKTTTSTERILPKIKMAPVHELKEL